MRVYEVVTARIVALLEAGVAPWRQPWKDGQAPANLVSRKPYRGVNVFLLACQQYACPYWLTFRQAREAGGHVKKGEHGAPVVFWKQWEVEGDGDEDGRTVPILRYYTVFNALQCELPAGTIPTLENAGQPFVPIDRAERVVEGMPKRPSIRHEDQRAYYRPDLDFVNVPPPETFATAEHYYAVLFHELTHATGHETRLARKSDLSGWHAFGTPEYAREELVAEMGAAFLCGHTGIENATLENSAAYLDGWIRKLKGDPKLIVTAASQAQKAADFILAA